jgi:lysyl-tRNA synthetase class 2
LNDPIDQRDRFEEQTKLMERGDDEAMFIDMTFKSFRIWMPPTAGIGFRIDRICIVVNSPHTGCFLFPMMSRR